MPNPKIATLVDELGPNRKQVSRYPKQISVIWRHTGLTAPTGIFRLSSDQVCECQTARSKYCVASRVRVLFPSLERQFVAHPNLFESEGYESQRAAPAFAAETVWAVFLPRLFPYCSRDPACVLAPAFEWVFRQQFRLCHEASAHLPDEGFRRQREAWSAFEFFAPSEVSPSDRIGTSPSKHSPQWAHRPS